jgi:hypothetical protein
VQNRVEDTLDDETYAGRQGDQRALELVLTLWILKLVPYIRGTVIMIHELVRAYVR